MTRRPALTGLMVLLWSSAAVATVDAAETYVGTVTVSSGAQPSSTQLKVTIREYTSDDRAFALAEKLHQAGQGAAVAEMNKTDVGMVQLGEEPSLRATLIRQEKTATGRIVRVVTDRPLHLGGARPAATLPPDVVGYVELQLDASGVGSGRALTAVKATFDAEGFVVPESFGETWPVSSVKPVP